MIINEFFVTFNAEKKMTLMQDRLFNLSTE